MYIVLFSIHKCKIFNSLPQNNKDAVTLTFLVSLFAITMNLPRVHSKVNVAILFVEEPCIQNMSYRTKCVCECVGNSFTFIA